MSMVLQYYCCVIADLVNRGAQQATVACCSRQQSATCAATLVLATRWSLNQL